MCSLQFAVCSYMNSMDKDKTVAYKSKQFALRIVRLVQYLKEDKKEYILSKQILRSGTSIGANVAECEFAFSRKDFLSKMYIALKECGETIYWIDLLHDADYIDDKAYESIKEDCQELLRMMQAYKIHARKGIVYRQFLCGLTAHCTLHTTHFSLKELCL